MSDPFPDEVDEALWDEACRRAEAVREFLKHRPGKMTAADVALLATEVETSRATAYRLIKLFRAGGTVMSLVDRKRGRPEGHRVLDDKREEIIRTTINRHYLTRNRPTVSQLVRDVQTNCISAGLKRPHRRTIKARLEEIELQRRAKRRGETEIVKQTQAVPGVFAASRPLQVVQVDHTKADIFCRRRGDPAADRPALADTGDGCLQPHGDGILPDDGRAVSAVHQSVPAALRLRQIGLVARARDHRTVARRRSAGNAARRQRRLRAFKRGCQDAGIAIEWRPPGEPRFGGHIERLIGTQMGKLHLLPGTTFSNAQELGEYDSKRHAALTLRELERYIALDIVGFYHQSIHSSLGRPPIAVWKEHEGEIPLRLPQDRMRFWLTFLPEQERTLRPNGIHLFGLRYWSPALSADVGRSNRRLLVKYDPRDMARVFVRRPSGSFVEARYADLTLPSVTLHEAVAARRTLLAGRQEINTRAIVGTAVAQRKLVDAATKKTAAARHGRAGKPKTNVDDRGWGSLRGIDSSKPVPFVEDTE